jgi:calcineurin-like phosphoesterase family protein
MSNIYFTSDTHYSHKNIVKGTSSWEEKDKCRDFNTIEEHNDVLVNNINQLVKENDILYHLGDWSFGGKDKISEFRNKLNCKNIHIILRNHDHWIEQDFEIQKLFSSVQHYKEVAFRINSIKSGKFGKTKMVLSHYAMRVWNNSHHGAIMLYGHSHGTLDELTPNVVNPTWIGDQYFIKNYRTMDVGVDTNNLFPYHLDEIVEIMKNREMYLEIDHHNPETT